MFVSDPLASVRILLVSFSAARMEDPLGFRLENQLLILTSGTLPCQVFVLSSNPGMVAVGEGKPWPANV